MTAGGPAQRNIHATAIVVGDRGLVIVGPSGSGKTTLATALVEHFSRQGKFSRLVGDDQLFVEARHGRTVARAPATIAGLVEVPGLGPRAAPHEPAAIIDLCIRLAPAAGVPRFQDEAREDIAGCPVPTIVLAARNVTAALSAVAAELEKLTFRGD
jgi:serine kinase of HPr protein (carbohydrate metabolism regulator)